ncbi:MAG: hypothetical protein WAV04_03835 [Candidatus Microsaccharimonas sp.]
MFTPVNSEAGAHLMKIIGTTTVFTYHILKGGVLVIHEGPLKNKRYVLSDKVTGNHQPIVITTFEYALPSGELAQCQALTRENTKTCWLYDTPIDAAIIDLLRRTPSTYLGALIEHPESDPV